MLEVEKDQVFSSMKKVYYNIVGSVQRRAMKMIEGLENLPCEDRLQDLRSSLPGQEKARGGLIHCILILKGSSSEASSSVFTKCHMEKTRGNKHKLHWDGFHLDIKKINFLHCKKSMTRTTSPGTW